MNKLTELLIELEREVKKKERELDNPALTLHFLSELEFFLHAVEDQIAESKNNKEVIEWQK